MSKEKEYKEKLREWAEWYAEFCASGDEDAGDPPHESTDKLLGVIYRAETSGQGYTKKEILNLCKGNKDYAQFFYDTLDGSWEHIETIIDQHLNEGMIKEVDDSYVIIDSEELEQYGTE